MAGHLLDTCTLSLFIHRNAQARFPETVARVREIEAAEGLAVSYVTVYEVLRGLLKDKSQGQSIRKLARFEMLLEEMETLGLDGLGGYGWRVAANVWVDGQKREPAVSLSEADLLIAATAEHHGKVLVTSDARLVELLGALGRGTRVELVPVG